MTGAMRVNKAKGVVWCMEDIINRDDKRKVIAVGLDGVMHSSAFPELTGKAYTPYTVHRPLACPCSTKQHEAVVVLHLCYNGKNGWVFRCFVLFRVPSPAAVN